MIILDGLSVPSFGHACPHWSVMLSQHIKSGDVITRNPQPTLPCCSLFSNVVYGLLPASLVVAADIIRTALLIDRTSHTP